MTKIFKLVIADKFLGLRSCYSFIRQVSVENLWSLRIWIEILGGAVFIVPRFYLFLKKSGYLGLVQ